MKNFIQDGDVLTVTAPYDVASGAGCQVGTIFGVAALAAASGASVQISTTGVYSLAKLAAQAWSAGDRIYFDNTEKECTTVAAGNLFIGYAVAAAANPSSTGDVRLNGAAPDVSGDITQADAVADVGALAAPSAIADIALSTSDTYSDAAVNGAVNAAIAEAETADGELKAHIDTLQAKIDAILAELRQAGLIAT